MEAVHVSYLGMWGEHQTGLVRSATGQKNKALAELGQVEVLELRQYYSCDIAVLPQSIYRCS